MSAMTKSAGDVRVVRRKGGIDRIRLFLRPVIPLNKFAGMLIIALIVDCFPALGRAQIQWRDCLGQPVEWYRSDEAVRIADNLLLYQFPSGGWPKNIDMARCLSQAEMKQLAADNAFDSATIDNYTTYPQLRYLAQVYTATKLERFRNSFVKGFDYLIKAQYQNGGWPQFFPLRKGYYSHITFNDYSMTGVMNLLADIAQSGPDFSFVDDHRKGQAQRSLEKGISCILKCQIVIDGKRTAWCAQHDERTFKPAKARTYELPSLSGAESVGIVEFLVRIDNPPEEVVQSIQSAIAWFQESRIEGIRVVPQPDSSAPNGVEKVVMSAPQAPPMWARFYRIGSNKPLFCSRDGVMRDSLSQISSERRNHYVWLGYWPASLLSEKYPAWLTKNHLKSVLQ